MFKPFVFIQETLPTPEVKSNDPVADLQSGLKAKTSEATAEGKKDIHDASVTSAGYVQQAKDLGAATLDTVQVTSKRRLFFPKRAHY